jgi:hypothetical protein
MPSYKGHRYPVEIINHCVWLYFRFPLSFREVEELMLERGVAVSYETIRRWCAKFGQAYASGLRRRRPRPGDKWHCDEVFIRINGTQHYLWRAVDQHGNVLDNLVQSRRNAVAAKRFFRKLLKNLEYVPRVIVTDQTRQLPGRPPRAAGICRASPLEVPQQSDRELASTHQAAGTGDETVHIARARAAVLVRVQWHFTAFSAGPAPTDRTRMAYRDGRPLHGLAGSHRDRRCLKGEQPNGVS